MVIDTAAILAIVQAEPERRRFLAAMGDAAALRMSVVSCVESSLLIESRYSGDALRDFDRFIARARIELIPVDREQTEIARSAFGRFGKGRHRAALNLGDCFLMRSDGFGRAPAIQRPRLRSY